MENVASGIWDLQVGYRADDSQSLPGGRSSIVTCTLTVLIDLHSVHPETLPSRVNYLTAECHAPLERTAQIVPPGLLEKEPGADST